MKGKIVVFLLMLGAFSVEAQKYTTAIGGRLGNGIGLTVQQKLWKNTTFEGILNQRVKDDEIVFTALLERHQKLIGKRFNFYLGAGPHFGWNSDFETQTGQSMVGLTGIAGLEFTLGRLNLSWDFKPALNITGGTQALDPQTAISLRYVFIKHQKKKKKVNLKFWEKDQKKKKKKKKA